jgi:RNA polymerase sigma-70 factor (ECF subfamily)
VARRSDPLVARAVGGDPEARAELVRVYGPLVYGLCRRLCPEADDAYQEVWEKVFGAVVRFDPEGPASVRTWIATITHRHLVDRHRRRTVRGEVVELGDRVAPEGEEPIDARRRLERLDAALQRLPEGHRRVVVMHHLEDTSLEQIAETEGIAVGTVKSRLHRARARLLELLGGRS